MGYYVVIDLEMCKVPKNCRKGFHHGKETIQIGAALMNAEYEVIDTYSIFVKPQFGYLDDFIKNLTGITETDLKEAPSIEEAIESFMNWLPKNEKITAISWSDADQYQFKYEIESKKFNVSQEFNELLENWIDCQLEFNEKMHKNKNFSLEEALVATNIITDGRAHDGLADAYNTALLYAKMQREDELVLNKYYKLAHEDAEPEHLSFCFGDLLAAAGF